MSEEHQSIGPGWRVFQAVALVVAVSWLFSYFVIFGPSVPELQWGDIVGFLSPIISLYIIGIAVVPEKMSFMQERNWKGWAGRGLLGVLSVLWMINVFIGTPMVNKLFTIPLEPSGSLPIFAGVFLHVVFQHWFQTLAGLAMALIPQQFATLTESPTPAGVQCAVVQCE